MKNLNQVQNALEAKAKNEVAQIVEKFIEDINFLESKYGCNNSWYILQENPQREINCQVSHLKHILVNSLFEKHCKRMVEYKTEELLGKLELI